MPTDAFGHNYTQVVAAIQYCLDSKLHAPLLILIYSTMDSYAWAVSAKDERSVRKRFVEFVDKWLQPTYPLPCTAIDLYSARCGILHTLTGGSDLTNEGKARPIAYAWGAADPKTLDSLATSAGASGVITLHVDDLANALVNTMLTVHAASLKDPVVHQRLLDAAGRHYIGMKKRTVEQLLQQVHDKPTV